MAEANLFNGSRPAPYPIYCDPARNVYQAFGIERATLPELTSPSLFLRSFEAFGKGNMQGKTMGDSLQKPATFVVDQTGIVRLAHYAKHPGDHLPVEKLLARAEVSS